MSAKARYRTAPEPMQGMPPGIPYIVANEGAERYSYYGMRAILVIFMTKFLMNAQGELDVMTDEQAKTWFHGFVTAVYFFPILGAIISDAFLGKYRTIIALSIVYCLGHLTLAIDDTRAGLALGLGLIAVGSGGIKPCVSAHVGDQFGQTNSHLLPKVFGWFYFAINVGALASILFAEPLLHRFGASVAFGVPGVLMAIATFAFWMGRNKFVHIPPGGVAFLREVFSGEGLKALAKLFIIYAFIAMFWALFDQQGSAWVLQAARMDRRFGIDWDPSQAQWLNPALVLLFIPLFNRVVYPAFDRFWPLTPLRKISIGLFLTVFAFLVPAWVEARLDAGESVNIAWQLGGYILITAAEILVSITALEFSYTQAPKRMKSLVMGAFLMSVSIGNLFTAGVNYFIQNPDGTSKLEGPSYYLFFAGAMAVTAILFVPVAAWYKEQTYIQDEAPSELPQ
ncbi:MAG: POT family MFS transporter [Myxococcales bacterium]|nr:POT family MFS transporter [Myxococcales bacterium]MDH3843581.1 POT family MFS transporter [Myxococcales bacterium]